MSYDALITPSDRTPLVMFLVERLEKVETQLGKDLDTSDKQSAISTFLEDREVAINERLKVLKEFEHVEQDIEASLDLSAVVEQVPQTLLLDSVVQRALTLRDSLAALHLEVESVHLREDGEDEDEETDEEPAEDQLVLEALRQAELWTRRLRKLVLDV